MAGPGESEGEEGYDEGEYDEEEEGYGEEQPPDTRQSSSINR